MCTYIRVLCVVAQSCPTLCNPLDCSLPGSPDHEDSPGKYTGVGRHALLQGIFPIQGLIPGLPQYRRVLYQLSYQGSPCYIYAAAAAAKSLQSCPTLCNPMDCSPPGSSVHGNSPGKNTGVGCHALLQGILPTQGSNPGLLHCRLGHKGSLMFVRNQHNSVKQLSFN